jgi:NO-binding membrane sensor protein with MHYT domain
MSLAVEHVHHFDLGGWVAFFAYATSAVGATVGLACATLARRSRSESARLAWLGLASLSIGGVGIWLMHFIAMLGFTTPGLPVRYDVGRTGLSAILAVAAVFGGLLVFGARRSFAVWRLLVGGVITGVAVALMHYTGMWAVNLKGTITYDSSLVALSIAIAVLAATVALWFTVAIERLWLQVLAGMVMAVAVVGMHYTGMAAIRAHLDPSAPAPAGVEVFSFLLPIFVLAAVVLAVTITALLMAAPDEYEQPAPKDAGAAREPVGSAQ